MLFNMVGYRVVYAVMEKIATQKLDAKLDAGDYAEENLVEIRVPLNMPYQDRVTDFERKYGEITIDGKAYTYVKMKIDRDMMVLKCIANNSKEQIKSTTNNLAKANSAQDMDNTGKKNIPSNNKNFSSDYDDNNCSWNLVIKHSPITLYHQNYAASLQDVFLKIPHQPPKC
jgi:hypothetical protein